jgi:hypothetical protein
MTEIKQDYIEIDILDECFVCFDKPDNRFISLKCCNRQNIHEQCLFNIFLNYLPSQGNTISCPLCRQNIILKDYFTLDKSIELFSSLNEHDKHKFFPKFNAIISYNYIESNHTIQVDETTSTVTIVEKSVIKRYLFTFVIFVILVACVIGFKLIAL